MSKLYEIQYLNNKNRDIMSKFLVIVMHYISQIAKCHLKFLAKKEKKLFKIT